MAAVRQRATSSDGRDGCSTVPPLGVQGGCEGVSWTPATHGSNTPSTVRVRRPIPHQFRPAGVTEAFPEKTLLRTCLCLFSQCPVPDRIDIRMEFLPRSLIPWPALCARDFFALSVESSFLIRIPKLDFVIANLHTVGRVGHLPDAHAPPLGRAFAFLILFSLNSYRNSGDKQQTHVPALINHTNQLIC